MVKAIGMVVAVNLGIGFGMVKDWQTKGPAFDLVMVALFPMGDVLMIVGLIALARRSRRGSFHLPTVGFELGGAVAFVLILIAFVVESEEIHALPGKLAMGLIGPGLGMLSFAATLFLLPQLGVAFVGWWLGRWYEPPDAGRMSDRSVDW